MGKHVKKAKKLEKNITICPGLLGLGIRSGGTSTITHTAAITVFTVSGGFFMDFTSVMSAGFRVFNALIASEKQMVIRKECVGLTRTVCEGTDRNS